MSARETMDVEELYQRYGPMVMRRCRQLLREENEALDATQDVFVQILKRRDRLEMTHPSSLLYRIATNLCLNRIRDRQRRATMPGDGFLERVAVLDDTEPRLEARSVLERLFGRHQESTRTMAVLHFQDGMTLEEVAGEVGMSVSGVRKRLRGLRASLGEVVKEEEE
ncbi:MAG: RNA polymerase subunit sigma-24 [Gemmatimonadetes bacterium]|jgi:RNA polymerase sigma-70 factor (ECF subfamily)|nr:RNA polymerase subunit sigma-24 [Gemmatimonadota bacterium]